MRRYASRSGVSVNLEQQVTDDLGLFALAGIADGAYESFDVTDIDRTLSGGASLTGKRWGRLDDTRSARRAWSTGRRPHASDTWTPAGSAS